MTLDCNECGSPLQSGHNNKVLRNKGGGIVAREEGTGSCLYFYCAIQTSL